MNDNTPDSPNPTQGMGKTMMILAWAAILGLLVLFFAEQEESAYNPNRSPTSEQGNGHNTVVLQRNRYSHYVTRGTINTEKVTFLLDTGATDVVVPEILAQRLGLIKGQRQKVNTANGTITVYKTRINTLTIGSISLQSVNASINPYMEGEEILLGMSALKNIEFTQRGDQLTLKQYQ